MKTYSVSELTELAKPYFEQFQVNKLYATSDAQFFLLENRASLHAGDKMKVHKIENEGTEVDASGEEVPKRPTVKELQAIISTASLEQLGVLLHEEVSSTNRSTAVKAIEAQMDKLSNPQ